MTDDVTSNARRRFIIQSATALAAAPLISSVGFAQTPQRKLGVALVGLGSLSEKQIAPALLKTRNCRLAGIVTGTPSKAAEWQKKYNLPANAIYNYENMHEMAKNKDIDIVYVVTPNSLHLPHSLAAAAAGKHVFCEKPLEINTERAQKILEACKKAGVQLGVGYRLQFEANNLECVRLAREKVLGDVKIIDANFGFAIGDPDAVAAQARSRRRRRAHGRRHLLPADRAHDHGRGSRLDLRFRSEDRQREVQGSRRDHHLDHEIPQRHHGELHQHVRRQRLPGIPRRHHASGWFGLDPAYYYGGNRGRRSDGTEINIPVADQFATELDDFADCILNKRAFKVNGEMGVSDVKYLMAVYDSIKKGKPVAV